MTQVTHKMIVIPHNGPIYPKGSIHGPITTPYREDVRTIGSLVMGGYNVEEVLTGDVRVKLNVSNFDQDNSGLPVDNTVDEEAQKREAEEAARRAEQERIEAEEAAQRQAEEEKKAAEEAAKQEAQVKAQQQQQKPQHQNQKNQHKQKPQQADVK